MVPNIGCIVHYVLSQDDAERINRRRTTNDSIAQRVASESWPVGAQAHIGNMACAGDVVPLMVARMWPDDIAGVNGQAFLDGNDTLWLTSVKEGTEPGTWHWPATEPKTTGHIEVEGQYVANDGCHGEKATIKLPVVWSTTLAVLLLALPSMAFAANDTFITAKEEVFRWALSVLVPAVGTGLLWLLVQLGRWLSTVIHDRKTSQALGLVQHFADVVVHELEATIRQTLSAPGAKLDKAGVLALRDAALTRLKVLLGTEGLATARALLQLGHEALDKYLSGTLEAAVARMKSDQPPTNERIGLQATAWDSSSSAR